MILWSSSVPGRLCPAITVLVTNREISAGKNPMGLAATVVYISCIKTGENITQKDIAQAAGITDVTLRNRFKDLTDKLQLN
jgi:transcription initiation factor TFIIB